MASFSEQIRVLEERTEKRLNAELEAVEKLDAKAIPKLLEKTRTRRALLSIKPEFTPEVVGIAKEIIAFGGAGLGFALAFGEKMPAEFGWFTILIGTFYLNLIVVSLAILAWFFMQARTRYPWLYLNRLGNSDQYFYYNAVPTNYSFAPIYMYRKDRRIYGALESYLGNLSKFAKRCITETPVEELKNEIIQYHLLLFYQGYLDQYEQQLTHTAIYGFSASLCVPIVILALRNMGVVP